MQSLASALPSAEIGTAQQENPVAISEDLWFEIQDAAISAVDAVQSTQTNSKTKAALVAAVAVSGVALYCTCSPTGRQAVKGLFNAGRNRLAKWIAVENEPKVQVVSEVEVLSED